MQPPIAPIAEWDVPASRSVAERWVAACSATDPAAIAALFAADGVVFSNHDRGECAPAAYADRMKALLAGFDAPRFGDFRILYQPGGFVGTATLARDAAGGMVATPFCVVADVRDGLIVRLEEYLDATTLADAA